MLPDPSDPVLRLIAEDFSGKDLRLTSFGKYQLHDPRMLLAVSHFMNDYTGRLFSSLIEQEN